MYEVVLRGRRADEIRFTDQPLQVGQRLEIDHAMWEVESEEPAENPDVDSRYILRPAGFPKP